MKTGCNWLCVMKHLAVMIIIVIFSAGSVASQEILTVKQLESVMNPEMFDDGKSIFRFDVEELNVGQLSEDDEPADYAFHFTNISDRTVTITRIQTACDCTDAMVEKKIFKPQEKGVIHVRYNPENQAGKLFSRIFVYTDLSETKPVSALALTGMVNPTSDKWKDYRYAMGQLRVRRTAVSFTDVSSGQKRIERIPCANAGNKPYSLRIADGFLPECVKVYTEPELLRPSETGEIVIVLDASKIKTEDGNKTFRYNLLLEGLSSAPSERMIKVKIEMK